MSEKIDVKNKWVQWLEDHIGNHKAKSIKHPIIALNDAYARGDQYKKIDLTTGNLIDVSKTRETKMPIPFIGAFNEIYVSRMLKDDPIPFATPNANNTEDTDLMICEIANGLWPYFWETLEMTTKMRQIVSWGFRGGDGIAKLYFDSEGGGKAEVSEIVSEPIYNGSIRFEVVHPLYFWPSPNAVNMDDMFWCVHQYPVHRRRTEIKFGLEKDKLSPEQKSDIDSDRESSTNSVDNYATNATYGDDAICIMNEIWIKKDFDSEEYPNGKHINVASKNVLGDPEDLPEDEENNFPFYKYSVMKPDDDWFGKGYVKDLIPIQRFYNKLNSLIAENLRWTAANKLLVPRECGMDKWTDEVEIVEYNLVDGGKPEAFKAAPLAQELFTYPEILFRAAQMITKITDAGMGNIPFRGSQTTPGVINRLIESMEINFSNDINNLSDFIKKIAQRILELVHKYFDIEQIVKIVGKNKREQVEAFKKQTAEELKKKYNINITVGKGFTMSPQARFDQLTNLAQTGFFEKAGIPLRWVAEEVLKLGNMPMINEKTFADQKQAKRALEKVLKGEPVIPSKFSNFDAYIQVFTDYSRSYAYEKLDPEMRKKIDMNIEVFYATKYEAEMSKAPPPMPQQGAQEGMPQGGGEAPMPQLTPSLTEQQQATALRSQGQGQPPTEGGMMGA